jgi:hypothetical protein
MAVYSQAPGQMSLQFRAGDSLSTLIDFDPISLSGYTVSSQIVSLVTGQPVKTITTTVVDAAAGKVNVSLTSLETAQLPPGSYGWELKWTDGSKRTALSGVCEVTR